MLALHGEKLLTQTVATNFRSWRVKPLALVHTDVQEVVLLNADVIPMQDPASIRNMPGYNHTGAAFFFDRVKDDPVNFNSNVRGGPRYLRCWLETFDYGAFNLSAYSEAAPTTHLVPSFAYAEKTCHEQDSSRVLVDKQRAGRQVMDMCSGSSSRRSASSYPGAARRVSGSRSSSRALSTPSRPLFFCR